MSLTRLNILEHSCIKYCQHFFYTHTSNMAPRFFGIVSHIGIDRTARSNSHAKTPPQQKSPTVPDFMYFTKDNRSKTPSYN